MLLTLANGLLGAVCGMCFRVQILVPLIAFSCVEEAVVRHTGTWWSEFWFAMTLIVAVEIGYLAGGSVVALRLSSGRGTTLGDIVGYQRDKSWSR